MKTFEYTIKDTQGIHARPAGLLVKEIKRCESTVMIGKNGKSVEGADEESAAAALETFLTENLCANHS